MTAPRILGSLWAGAHLRRANRWQAAGAALALIAPWILPLAGPDIGSWLGRVIGALLAYLFLAGNSDLGLGRRQDAPAPAPDGELIELAPEYYGLLTARAEWLENAHCTDPNKR